MGVERGGCGERRGWRKVGVKRREGGEIRGGGRTERRERRAGVRIEEEGGKVSTIYY